MDVVPVQAEEKEHEPSEERRFELGRRSDGDIERVQEASGRVCRKRLRKQNNMLMTPSVKPKEVLLWEVRYYRYS